MSEHGEIPESQCHFHHWAEGANVFAQFAEFVKQLGCDGELAIGWGSHGEISGAEEAGDGEAGEGFGLDG